MKNKQIFPPVKLKLIVSGVAAKCSSALKLVCIERYLFNSSLSPGGQTMEKRPKDESEDKKTRE